MKEGFDDGAARSQEGEAAILGGADTAIWGERVDAGGILPPQSDKS